MSVKRGLVIAGGTVGILAVVAVLASLIFARQPAPAPLIPKQIQTQMDFTLYYPTTLPGGLAVQSNSFKVPAKDVLVFMVTTRKGNLAISEQRRPPRSEFDIDNFYQTKVANPTTFVTTVGEATTGQLVDQSQFGSLLAGQTWIIAKGPGTIDPESVTVLINAFRLLPD